jgi:tetratricopeptide (TPR) repeat protein
MRSDWAKGYSRKGAALFGLGRYAEAVGTYQQGLAYEPDNVQMRQACVDIEDKLQLSTTLFEAVMDGSVPRTTAALQMGASPDAFTGEQSATSTRDP